MRTLRPGGTNDARPARTPKARAPKVGRPKGRFTQHRRVAHLRQVLEAKPHGLTLEELAESLKITERSIRRYLGEFDDLDNFNEHQQHRDHQHDCRASDFIER